ncbi:hypothetical protein FE257_003270 [Aspergillus nanangensis]|uniref:RING finger domain protein n=1 Tax=Aspergillus nanangensis TaxID=2582783 RepID=A0AAD4CSA5_ASPNN|nr:hypothetical protein FE257_003270 [Aspergillus nanangensis]
MTSTNGEASSTSAAFAFPSFASSSFPPLLPFPSWPSGFPFDMNNDPGVEIMDTRPRKLELQRSRREIPESSQSGREHRPRNGEPSSTHHPLMLPTMLPPPSRYPGDGYDHRRPAMSSTHPDNEVIDLTNDPDSPPQRSEQHQHQHQTTSNHASRQQRLPRFPREIMTEVVHLDSDDDDYDDGEEEQIPIDVPSSPEVQFVGSNVRSAPLPPPPRNRNRAPAFMAPMLQMLRYLPSNTSRSEGGLTSAYRWPHPQDINSFLIGERAVDLTINLDVEGYHVPSPGIDRRSTYKPPSPPPEGFTRTVGEDDLVCCPNCDAELGTGDEIKKQIWVAKQCGHVYCGECTTNRSKSNAKKTSQKVNPFSKCQVAGCGKPISAPRSMFQIYL